MNPSPTHPAKAWLTSSGIDSEMGGIASVTRSCLAALALSESPIFPERIITLQGESDASAAVNTVPSIPCNGNRMRFALEVSRQLTVSPDLILHEHVDLAQCQTLLPPRLRRPSVIWGHGIELWRPLPARKQRALAQADLLLFNSHYTRKKALSFHPWLADRPFRIVPLCREADRAPAEAAPSEIIAQRKPWILTVGRLVEDRPKGHAEILRILPLLAGRVPNLHWHIVGDGPWRKDLAAQIAASPLGDQVTLHGFVSNDRLAELYRNSRVFAMPSHGEGFGLVYAEAMANGLPCVASTLDAAPEVIASAGACVDLTDPTVLADALLHYLTAGNDEFTACSIAARARSTYFELPRFAGDLISALKSVIKYPV